jgi:hypothetical protein
MRRTFVIVTLHVLVLGYVKRAGWNVRNVLYSDEYKT